jgi:hypothetical protein
MHTVRLKRVSSFETLVSLPNYQIRRCHDKKITIHFKVHLFLWNIVETWWLWGLHIYNVPTPSPLKAAQISWELPTFSRQSAHRWRWDCQPYAPAALYPQEDSWYTFIKGWIDPQGHSAAGIIWSNKKSNDVIGNQTSDLPACSIVPQSTMLPSVKTIP